MPIESRVAKLVPFDLRTVARGGPMDPILDTEGLEFQYTPTITESVSVEYESFSAPHTNEKFHVFKGRDNRKIDLGNAVFTADTAENLRYMVAAIHFFRTYTHMDYGQGKTARPPSPMWFYAYGALGFQKVPVLLSGYSLSFDGVAHDLVDASTSTGSTVQTNALENPTTPLDEIGDRNERIDAITQAILVGVQNYNPNSDLLPEPTYAETPGLDIVVPMKLEVSGLQLIVQHSPKYWKRQFSLEDFRAGRAMESRESAATLNHLASRPPTQTQVGPVPEGGVSVFDQPETINADVINAGGGSIDGGGIGMIPGTFGPGRDPLFGRGRGGF